MSQQPKFIWNKPLALSRALKLATGDRVIDTELRIWTVSATPHRLGLTAATIICPIKMQYADRTVFHTINQHNSTEFSIAKVVAHD